MAGKAKSAAAPYSGFVTSGCKLPLATANDGDRLDEGRVVRSPHAARPAGSPQEVARAKLIGLNSSVASMPRVRPAPRRGVARAKQKAGTKHQCNLNSASTSLSSAGRISFECATVTLNSLPSSVAFQKSRNDLSLGKRGATSYSCQI